MIKIKNISEEIKPLHTHEFQVNEELEIDSTWYFDQVIIEITNGNFQIIYNDTPVVEINKQLEYLRGNISKVEVQGPKDASGRPIISHSPFSDTGGFRFRGASFTDTVATGTTKDIDYGLTAERWINGGRLIVDNIGDDDKITFQVVDKDNILGLGAGVVLDEFIKDFYIPKDGDLQVNLAYPARIVQGLYIRLKYTSTHASGCTLKCNLYLHWKAA